MPTLRPRIARHLPNLGLGAASLLLATLLAEAVVRSTAPQPLDPTSPGLYELESERSYRLRPGHRGTFTNLTEFEHRLEINSRGLRGPEIGARGPGEHRLLVLGDSFTFGWGVAAEDAFPARLEGALELEHPGLRVLNGGVPGYGLPDEVEWLERWGVTLEPSAVLVAVFLGNDLLDATAEHRGVKIAGGFVAGDSDRGPQAWLHRSSHLLRLAQRAAPLRLRARLRSILGFPPPWELDYMRHAMAVYATPAPRLAAEGRSATRRAFERLLRLGEERRFQTALVLLPARLQVDPGHWRATLERLGLDPRAYHPAVPGRFFADLARRSGIQLLDLTPAVRAAVADGDRLYYRHDPHWTVAGHRLAADSMVAFLSAILNRRGSRNP